MKIGIDGRPLSYELTGIGYYLMSLLDQLQEIDRTNFYYLISNAPISYRLKNPKWRKIEGICKGKLRSTIWLQAKTPPLAAKLGLNLFWGPRHHLPLLLPRKVKTVTTIHDLVFRIYPQTMNLPNLFLERLLMKPSLKRSDAIISVSESTANDLMRLFNIQRQIINMIHSGGPALTMSDEDSLGEVVSFDVPEKYFLCIGTLDPRKNLDRILTAFESIEPKNQDVHLLIVGGKGWKNGHFVNRVKSHQLSSHIHLTGYLPRIQLEAVYKRAISLVFTSLYEGFGLPILEAMSCGTPVIASNVSSMPEVAGNAAILVNPYNVEAIAKAMLSLLNNEKLRDKLRLKGFKNVKRFSWRRCAVETLKVFERVVA